MKGRRATAAFAVAISLSASYAVYRTFHQTAAPTRWSDSITLRDLGAAQLQSDTSRGARLFGQCSACHPIGRDSVDRDGPNLYGVVGAAVAARRPRFAYTAALRRFGGVWTNERLDAWLAAPAAAVPGTAMRLTGIASAQDRADLIAYLASQGPVPKPQ